MYGCALSLTSVLVGLGGQRLTPAALPRGMTRYSFYRRLGGPLGPSEKVRKISLQPGFVTQNVQPVASCHTYWAIQAYDVESVTDFMQHESFGKKFMNVGAVATVKVLRERDEKPWEKNRLWEPFPTGIRNNLPRDTRQRNCLAWISIRRKAQHASKTRSLLKIKAENTDVSCISCYL